MRITVYNVLDYLASGMAEEQIVRDFPYLMREDIQACMCHDAWCWEQWRAANPQER